MDWEGISTAILDRARAKLGLPSRMEMEATRAKQAQAAAESESGLETAALGRDKMRADMESQPELTRLRSETALAQAEAARTRAGQQPQPTGDAYLSSLDPTQLAEHVKRKKMVAEATRDPRDRPSPRGSSIIRTLADGREVAFYPGTGDTVELPGGAKPTAQEQNRRAQAKIARAAADDILASLASNKITGAPSEAAGQMGPVVGRTTTRAAQLFGGAKAATRMQTMLRSFASLLPILHGFRGGTQLQAEFEEMAGNIAQDPETVAARVQTLAAIADLIQQGASETAVQSAIDKTLVGGDSGALSPDTKAGIDALFGGQ